MHIHSETLRIATSENIEIINLTPRLTSVISSSGISNSFAIVSSLHTTTALFINEFEERFVEDIKIFFRSLVPEGKNYLHNDIRLRDCPPDEPENAHSHIMAMMLSSNEVIPVVDSKLTTGQWQSIMLAELDGPRERTVQIQVVGNNGKQLEA